MNARRCLPLVLLVAFCFAWPRTSTAQDDQPPVSSGTAPKGTVSIGRGLGGGYYVDKTVKEEYDKLVSRVRTLQEDVSSGRITEEKAQSQIEELRKEVAKALAEIENKKVFVEAAKAKTSRASMTFELGPAATLLINAAEVRVTGWDKPYVEVVVEKTLLNVEDADEVAEMAAIRIDLRQSTGAQVQDWPDASQRVADLQALPASELSAPSSHLAKYVAFARLSPDALAKLSPEVAARLRDPRTESALAKLATHVPFESVIDTQVNVLELHGLTMETGNKPLQLQFHDDRGGGRSIAWRRNAKLQVFVPKCKLIGILGGKDGIAIESVAADVEIAGEKLGRNSEASNSISKVAGSVRARDVRLSLVEQVSGDVRAIDTRFASDIMGGFNWNKEMGAPKPAVVRDIGGGFIGWFMRADLHITDVAGVVDVRNEFGNTQWTANKKPAFAAHRVLSEAGHIRLIAPADRLANLPTTLLCEVGNVFAQDISTRPLGVYFTLPIGELGTDRSWNGFSNQESLVLHAEQALRDLPRSPGIDLLTRSGSVRFVNAAASDK